jgi:hypothetical protein
MGVVGAGGLEMILCTQTINNRIHNFTLDWQPESPSDYLLCMM